MIDIAKDYLAISLGAAQVGSARAFAVGRSAVGQMTSLGRSSPQRVGEHILDVGADLAYTTSRSRELIAALIQAELDRAVSLIGLVPEAELIAVRQQVERLERRLSAVATGRTST